MSLGDWPLAALRAQLTPLLPGLVIEVLPTIDSSNTELMRRARKGALPPTLLIAEEQTAGRGRQGRSWYSGAGDVLAVSLGLPYTPRDWSGLSLAVGLSLAESLHPRVAIKWPNDLWLDGTRKLCGILIETASSVGTGGAAGQRYCVIGAGMNIRPRANDGLATPPAWLQELDPALDAPAALARIAVPLVQTVLDFARTGFAPLQPRYAARDLLRGREVTLSDGRHGLCEGVAADGALIVHTATGREAITSAEVSVRPVG